MPNTIVSGCPTDEEWSLAERFHGHLGPWMALGMRIGRIAVDMLQPRPHFGVHVHVRCPLRTPFSCIMDGLQLATGATLGKRNIETADSDESAIVVTVRNRDTGEAATFTVDPGVPALFGAWFAEVGGDQAARRVWSAGADELPGAEPIARSLTPARVEAG